MERSKEIQVIIWQHHVAIPYRKQTLSVKAQFCYCKHTYTQGLYCLHWSVSWKLHLIAFGTGKSM